jgi:SAM-dependent methyltransferase
MADNAEQKEFWNGRTGQKWAAESDKMDRNMSDIGVAALAFAAAREGERVIDIGCGAGATSLKLGEAVGANGSVTGVDISAPLLAIARERNKTKNVSFEEADASEKRFDQPFDLAFSRFGVMFFDDPVSAFKNIHGNLKKGGRLAFVCWRTGPENEWAFAPLTAARPFIPPQSPPDPTAPGPFAFADQARVKGILEQAGFRDVIHTKLDTTMRLGNDIDAALEQAMGIGPLARIVNEMTDEGAKAKVRAAVLEVVKKFSGPDGVSARAACWLVGATA